MVATTSGFVAGIAAALFYLAGTIVQVRHLSQPPAQLVKPLMGLAIPALGLHTLTTYLAIDTSQGIHLGLFATGSLVTLVMAAFVLLASLRLPVQNLLVLVFPFAALGVLGTLIGESSFAPLEQLSAYLVFHILTSIAAYSILFMAACQSLVLAVQEHYLRAKHGIALIRVLPPLETMETLLFSMLWAGLIALSIAIASGFLFLDNMFAQHVVHHTILSSLSWLMYVVLLAGHKLFGWRGVSAVRWTMIAFGLLVLGYFGSKFVLEILLQR
jgi:ABC-type uncharacterized transport system permease subunit